MALQRVAVIGAGPAGLAAADWLVRGGVDVEVFEAGSTVGGLARTIELWGMPVDLGPHIFAGGSPRALDLWASLLGDNPRRVPLKRGIATRGVVLAHPPRPLDLLRHLPSTIIARCVVGAAASRIARTVRGSPPSPNAEEWAVLRFGRPLYDTLLRDYIEKLWGLRGTEITAAFVQGLFGEAKRVKGSPSATSGIIEVDGKPFFLYPRGGTGAVWRRLIDRLGDRVTVHLDSRIDRILVDNGRVMGVRIDGSDRSFDHVISTMPLGRLCAALDAPAPIRLAAAGLQSRHAVVVHLRITGGEPLEYAWIYVYDQSIRVGRIVDSRTWQGVPNENGDGIVTMEYWCDDAGEAWNDDQAAVLDLARSDLRASGLLPGHRVHDGRVTRLPNALPVPSLASGDALRTIATYLRALSGLQTVGRHGGFSYNSMAESIEAGIGAATSALE